MKPKLLPHEVRHVFLWGHGSVIYVSLLLAMINGAIQDRRGHASQSVSRHSMYVTCEPRDMISLTTLSLRG
jgi:hypothetical protein